MLRLVTMLVFAMLLSACATNHYKSMKLTAAASHYTTEGRVYDADKLHKKVGIVFVHGKRGDPGSYHNDTFIADMKARGYQVIAPIMPWSELRGYTGSRTDGLQIINAAVKALPTRRVVVIGHSMGAMAVMQYGAGRLPAKVAGLVVVAAGHDPGNADKLRIATEAGADRACELVKQGKGKQRGNYRDINAGSTYDISATADYYCSYYSAYRYPDSMRVPRSIKVPVFMISGKDDRLTFVYLHKEMFATLPHNVKNKYQVLSGGHLDVLYRHTAAISKWIESL